MSDPNEPLRWNLPNRRGDELPDIFEKSAPALAQIASMFGVLEGLIRRTTANSPDGVLDLVPHLPESRRQLALLIEASTLIPHRIRQLGDALDQLEAAYAAKANQ